MSESKELDNAVRAIDARRNAIAKAHVIGERVEKVQSDVQGSNVMQGVDEAERRFHLAGAIEPPYNPATLAAMLEHSNSLRQNVDAYATNIDSFGHRFEPVFDMTSGDVDQRIAQAMVEERQARLATEPTLSLTPTLEEISARKRQLVEEMRQERTRLEFFFANCTDDISFVGLRRKIRQDLETIGNAYLEVLRNAAGEIAEFVYVPGFTMRLLPLDHDETVINVKQRTSETAYTTVQKKRRLRKYVQVFESYTVFFKEFGDPRVISKKTSAIFPTVEDLVAADATDSPATEILHLKVHSSRTSYGVPRWIGNLLSVLGSRQSEEVNFLYFENKSVPPLALLVSGGRVTQETVNRLESYIESEIKGKKNFHKMLIVEAEGAASQDGGINGQMKLELKPLTDAQQKDALFQQYDANNRDKVGEAFRVPRLLRGDTKDFNRATAEAALDFAEQQVFAPERDDFDYLVNKRILPELGIRFWRFKTNGTSLRDPAALAEAIQKLVLANVITPEEARELCSGVFGRSLARISAPWVKQPVPLTLAGIEPPTDTSMPWAGQDTPVGEHSAAFNDRDADGTPDEQEKAAEMPGGGLVTRTALGNVVTVNEARAAHGLGPKKLKDGSPDPDGELTIAEYMARAEATRAQMGLHPRGPAGAAPPAHKADADGPIASQPNFYGPAAGDMTIADLQTHGGQLALHTGSRRLRRVRPPARGVGAPSGGVVPPPDAQEALKRQASALLSLREALLDAEAVEAAKSFYERKRAELASAEVKVPSDVIASVFKDERKPVGEDAPASEDADDDDAAE